MTYLRWRGRGAHSHAITGVHRGCLAYTVPMPDATTRSTEHNPALVLFTPRSGANRRANMGRRRPRRQGVAWLTLQGVVISPKCLPQRSVVDSLGTTRRTCTQQPTAAASNPASALQTLPASPPRSLPPLATPLPNPATYARPGMPPGSLQPLNTHVQCLGHHIHRHT